MKLPNIKTHSWQSVAFNLFTFFGTVAGIFIIFSSYRYYLAGNMIDAVWGLSLGLIVIFIYAFNNLMVSYLAKSRFELFLSHYILNERLYISKMEIEITMRRAGIYVPDEFLADIPDFYDLNNYDIEA